MPYIIDLKKKKGPELFSVKNWTLNYFTHTQHPNISFLNHILCLSSYLSLKKILEIDPFLLFASATVTI